MITPTSTATLTHRRAPARAIQSSLGAAERQEARSPPKCQANRIDATPDATALSSITDLPALGIAGGPRGTCRASSRIRRGGAREHRERGIDAPALRENEQPEAAERQRAVVPDRNGAPRLLGRHEEREFVMT